MRIVVRNSSTHKLAELTEREAVALRAWYGNASSSEDEAIALALIRRVKGMDGWIECDCLDGRHQPLLAPIQQERTFTLRRLTPKEEAPGRHDERPNHALTCPFHVDKDTDPALFDRGYHLRPPPRSDRTYIDALPAIPTHLADVSGQDSARSTERPTSSARSGRPTPRSLSTMSGSWSLLPEIRRYVRNSRSARAKSPVA